MIITQSQVEQALQRTLSGAELESLEHLANEAEVLIGAHLRKDFLSGDPIPKAVTTVAARMVARALQVDQTTLGVQTQQQSTGPYQQSVTYIPETRAGNTVYLSKTDREMLSALKPSGVRHLRYGSGH